MKKLSLASLLMTAFMVLTSAYAQESIAHACPTLTIPVPADQIDIECRADTHRCNPVSLSQCQSHNDTALNEGLLTIAAYNWLEAEGYCSLVASFGAGLSFIVSICPLAETNSCQQNFTCGGQAPAGCYCDSICEFVGDCCPDGPC